MVFIVLSGFMLVLAVAILAVLVVWSWPGKPKPFLDENGRPLPDSISEKVRIDINGFEQGMILTAKDKTKPVLLFLHGGMPEYFLSQRYPTGLEAEFVVCWWQQRGAGLSWGPGDVTRIGDRGAPGCRHDRAHERPAPALWKRSDLPDGPFRRELPGDARRGPSARAVSRPHRRGQHVEGNARGRSRRPRPQGRHPRVFPARRARLHVHLAEASTYFDRLTAPVKGFYTFRESAHSPMFEEPDKFVRILREDVLNGTNRLADRK